MKQLKKCQSLFSLIVIATFAIALFLLPIQNQSVLILVSATIAAIFIIIATFKASMKYDVIHFNNIDIAGITAFVASVIAVGYAAITGFTIVAALIIAVIAVVVGIYAISLIKNAVWTVVREKKMTNLKATSAIIIQVIFIDACFYGIYWLKY